MTRYYLVPENRATPDERDPKYVASDAALVGLQWVGMDYGVEPVFLLAVFNPTAAQHIALDGKADVFAIPPGGVSNTNLDAAIGAGALAAVKVAMEAMFIPADWVTAQTTWRQFLAAFVRMCQFMQRLHGMYNVNLSPGRGLDYRLNQLPAGLRSQLSDVVQSFGWDTSGITGAWTVRQLLKWVSQQWAGPVYFAGESW